MTEINIRDFFCYDEDSIETFLHILKEKEFKIVIPRNTIEVKPVELIGMVEYDAAAYIGQLLSCIATHFSYYVPCSLTTAPFLFTVTIRDIKAFSETLYLIAQVFNHHTSETDLIIDFHVKANIFFDKYYNGDEISKTCGLISVANELQEPVEKYCMLPLKKRACINTAGFSKHSGTDLYVHLLKQNTNEFEIIIPATGDVELLWADFLNAAYAGHLLSETVNNFAYFVPSPGSKQSFYFHVTVNDFEKFTDTLYFIMQALNYHSGNDEDFEIKACEFLNDVYKEDIHCKTWGLHQLALQLLCDQ